MPKVMIVEDDFMIADGLEETLIAAGYEVCGIAKGVGEAIALGRKHRPDLAVIDLRLSQGGYGTDVAAALGPAAGLGILYASGNPDHPLLQRAIGEAYISKPYTATAVVAALQVVSERMARRSTLTAFPDGFRLLHA